MKEKEFMIARKSFFQNIRKVGLDSNVLISLITNADFFAYHLKKIFNEEDLFFTHRRCVKETVGKLTEKEGYNEEEARKAVNTFLKNYHIEIIEPNFDNDALLNEMREECKKRGIEFHIPDCWIIADFKKHGVNKVYSTNNHFLDACKLFGIDAVKFPTFEKELKNQLKKMFSYKK